MLTLVYWLGIVGVRALYALVLIPAFIGTLLVWLVGWTVDADEWLRLRLRYHRIGKATRVLEKLSDRPTEEAR